MARRNVKSNKRICHTIKQNIHSHPHSFHKLSTGYAQTYPQCAQRGVYDDANVSNSN